MDDIESNIRKIKGFTRCGLESHGNEKISLGTCHNLEKLQVLNDWKKVTTQGKCIKGKHLGKKQDGRLPPAYFAPPHFCKEGFKK